LTSRELPLEEIFYGVVWEHIVKGPDFFLLLSYVPLFDQRCTGSSVAAPQTEEKERAKEGAITIIELGDCWSQIRRVQKKRGPLIVLITRLARTLYKQVTFCSVFYTVLRLPIEYDNTLEEAKHN
jgi:hypothetical protein